MPLGRNEKAAKGSMIEIYRAVLIDSPFLMYYKLRFDGKVDAKNFKL